eukprot:jgi/Hompol1/2367/HPOL_002921-RA
MSLSPQEERQRSLEIDRQIERDRKERIKLIENPRLLLLGSSDSGKTTVIKQLKILHGGGFTDEEKAVYKSQIAHNILDAAKALIIGARKLCFESSNVACSEIPAEITSAIAKLWAADYIKEAWKHANVIIVQDTAD